MSSTSANTDPDKYIIFGIDFKDFLGTGFDLSGLVDAFGGAFNFEISSSLCCLFCLFSIFILIFFVTKKEKKGKGLRIPGIGTLGPQQPLIIQMPMMSKPYPFNDSVFSRDT